MASVSRSSLRRQLLDPVAWYISRRELRALMGREEGVEGIVSTTERYVGRGFYSSIHSVQERSEITALAECVQQLDPKVVVEVGTYRGGTLYIWCRVAQHPELVVSIDLPGGPYGGGYHQRRSRLYRQFLAGRPNARLALLRANSHDPVTLSRLADLLGERRIDLLYIDGDHTYCGVRQDFEMYSPFVRRDGIVAFHDIVTRTQQCGVHQLWSELRQRYPTQEFVGDGSGKGIGVLYAG